MGFESFITGQVSRPRDVSPSELECVLDPILDDNDPRPMRVLFRGRWAVGLRALEDSIWVRIQAPGEWIEAERQREAMWVSWPRRPLEYRNVRVVVDDALGAGSVLWSRDGITFGEVDWMGELSVKDSDGSLVFLSLDASREMSRVNLLATVSAAFEAVQSQENKWYRELEIVDSVGAKAPLLAFATSQTCLPSVHVGDVVRFRRLEWSGDGARQLIGPIFASYLVFEADGISVHPAKPVGSHTQPSGQVIRAAATLVTPRQSAEDRLTISQARARLLLRIGPSLKESVVCQAHIFSFAPSLPHGFKARDGSWFYSLTLSDDRGDRLQVIVDRPISLLNPDSATDCTVRDALQSLIRDKQVMLFRLATSQDALDDFRNRAILLDVQLCPGLENRIMTPPPERRHPS